ncbi:sensor histidine kinase [Streptomyces pinistramenti]|uniref:sensor histidine kinase n=1 Tax=Streptomyces pinistramenti TaxID=2884812 RepID=UPI001D076F4E|nr:sensor histidine kinase [Streptomyces pinistramenti]MCB5906986.1 sensor histidine kinase [Streptomyces pinistramenti]
MNRRSPIGSEAADPDARRLAAVMHITFFVLLSASLTRFLLRHPHHPATPWVIALAVTLALLYVLGPVLGPDERTAAGGSATTHRIWLVAVIAAWLMLIVLAPSFGWCAVPLFYTGLRSLGTRSAIVLVALLTAAVVAAQVKLRPQTGFDPNLLFAPPAVAAVATAVFIHSQRQAARLRNVIADLVRARRELAATERRAGTLAERQRLSMEIHDTLAQGLSSQQMLLQAADRIWDTDPATARCHVRSATSISGHNLAEARRFVHDLAPADLAGGGGLDDALRALAVRETTATLRIRFHQEGTPQTPLPDRLQSALLRIAQGALANVREHADATTVALTLTHLDDQVVVDIADDGRGFTPAAGPGGVRGHGLPAMRARVRQLGGTLTIETAPGEGTVLSAAIPLEPLS